jgi:hypothetical protein
MLSGVLIAIEANTRQSSGSGERDKTFQPVAGGKLLVTLK